MSAPKTDLEKQEKRHKVPLMGMGSMVLWAAVILVALIVWLTLRGNEPGEASDVQPDVTAPVSNE